MAGYDYGPSENELVLNVTSQLLQRLSGPYPVSTALAPTRREENVKGYDVDVRKLLGIVLQFKRPSAVKARRKPTRLPKPTEEVQPARFMTDIQQWNTLINGFGIGEAFYVIPPVLQGNQLHRALDRTVFVDVYGVLPRTSRLYTVPEGCETSNGPPIVEGFVKRGSTYRIPQPFIYCFSDLLRGLKDSRLGFSIYEPYNVDEEFNPEESIENQRYRGDGWSNFDTRIDWLKREDRGQDGKTIQDGILGIESPIVNQINHAIQTLEQEWTNPNQPNKYSDLEDPSFDTLAGEFAYIREKLPDTNDHHPVERWLQLFEAANSQDPYSAEGVRKAWDNEVVARASDSLRNELVDKSDTPSATHLLQRANSEMLMLGRQ